jgi:hypothetical protein
MRQPTILKNPKSGEERTDREWNELFRQAAQALGIHSRGHSWGAINSSNDLGIKIKVATAAEMLPSEQAWQSLDPASPLHGFPWRIEVVQIPTLH